MRYLYAVPVLVAALVTALAVTGTAVGDVDRKKRLTTGLTGAEEVPGPGDPDGRGTAKIRLNTAKEGGGARAPQVCWNISVREIETATMAHIHKAPKGEAGPIVVDLSPQPGEAEDGEWSGCRRPVDKPLVRDIIRNPEQYYVNVHNAPFPSGAIRGQLGD